MVYMSSSFWLLAIGSRNLSRTEREITACNGHDDDRLIKKCTKVIKVKAQGKHQELMESVDTYRSLFLENETSEI